MKRIMSLLFLSSFLAVPTGARAGKVVFSHDFAPSEGPVADLEKPERDAICLNGSWQFQPVAVPDDYVEASGNAPELTPPADDRWETTAIKIPSPWNVNGFSPSEGKGPDFHNYPSYPESWNKVEMGWLRRSFRVPEAWSGKRVVLHFGAIAGKAQVLVNGKLVGTHFDNFLPCEFDITDLLKPGADNELLVGVRQPQLFDRKGPYGRAPYQVGSMWGLYAIGIWQDVFLEALPPVRIDTVYVQPKVDQDELEADVTLKNDSDTPVSASVGGEVHPWKNEAGTDVVSAPEPKWSLGSETSVALASAPATIPAHGTATITLTQKVGDRLKLWAPGSPNLYGLVLAMKDSGGRARDVKYTRFGWRQFTFRGKETLLNGQPIVFKGDAWHFMGIPEMTRRYAWAWDKMLIDAGGNTLRLHAEPYPPFFLDVADEMGVMILDETAIYGSNGRADFTWDAFWNSADEEVADLVRRDRNHPAVMGWSVANEMAAFAIGVYHAPPAVMEPLKKHYAVWAATCRKEDPSRPWISADGDTDGLGQLPVAMSHYQGPQWMEQRAKMDIPWGIGEQGLGYYGSPEQIARFNGEEAYENIEGRMRGLGVEAYESLGWMQTSGGNYRSIFNMAWYGCQPLPLGHADTSQAPTSDEGIFFGDYVENKPGVQPERLGPYSTTFNPGYDPSLPLYKPWPFWEGIKAGFAEAPAPSEWTRPKLTAPVKPTPPAPVNGIDVLSGPGGKLGSLLTREGVMLTPGGDAELLFIDGLTPPDAAAKTKMQAVFDKGGTVFVWGVSAASVEALNALLPARLEVTTRQADALLPQGDDPLIAGIKPSDLYFSELEPATILDGGLDGPLVGQGKVLIQATDCDWQMWNHKGEDIKTACILRSQLEAKPSGVAMVELPQGKGRLVVCNITDRATIPKRAALIDSILTNLGVPLTKRAAGTNLVNVDGDLTGALVAGSFSVPSYDDGMTANLIDPSMDDIRAGADAGHGLKWRVAPNSGTIFDFRKMGLPGPTDESVAYLSFWVFSTKDLTNFLAESNLPKLSAKVGADDGAEIWLNGKSIGKTKSRGPIESNVFAIPNILLQKGWNHFLVKSVQDSGQWQFRLTFQCDQPDYLNNLGTALEKPKD